MEATQHNRFIPTYVGHTGVAERVQPTPTVHPHLRGAYGASHQQKPTPTVHPHLRGAYAPARGDEPRTLRFIPTYVGHTVDKE